MRHGIQNLSTHFFGGLPDIALAGFNVGSNLGIVTQFSGTVGAATEAVKESVPAIAFSGTTGSQTAWYAQVEPYEKIYAKLSTALTLALTQTGKPYLPRNVWYRYPNHPDFVSGTNICQAERQLSSNQQYFLLFCIRF